jgi:hypothetical protein
VTQEHDENWIRESEKDSLAVRVASADYDRTIW